MKRIKDESRSRKKRQFKHRPERDRAIFDLLRAISHLSPAEIQRKTKISAQTIRNWRKPVSRGGTRYPQHWTMVQAARAAGLVYALMPVDQDQPVRERPRERIETTGVHATLQ
jgi:hypothetical protein